MTRVIADPRQALDDAGDPRQRPEIRGEAMAAGPLEQRRLHAGQLRSVQPGLAPHPPGALEPGAPTTLPRVIPAARRHRRHAQRARDHRLRFAPREPARGLQPPCFQHGEIPSGPPWSRHTSAWHRSP